MTPQQIKQVFRKHRIDKVEVGGFDIDGVLRSKYVSLEKFFSGVESGLGSCDVIFGWDSSDALYDQVRLTGWLAKIDLSTFRLAPWEPGTALFLLDLFAKDARLWPSRRGKSCERSSQPDHYLRER